MDAVQIMGLEVHYHILFSNYSDFLYRLLITRYAMVVNHKLKDIAVVVVLLLIFLTFLTYFDIVLYCMVNKKTFSINYS